MRNAMIDWFLTFTRIILQGGGRYLNEINGRYVVIGVTKVMNKKAFD